MRQMSSVYYYRDIIMDYKPWGVNEEKYLLDLLYNPFSSIETIIEGAGKTLDRSRGEMVAKLKELGKIKEDYE